MLAHERGQPRGKSQPAGSNKNNNQEPQLYQIYSKRNPDKSTLPGDPTIYEFKMPKVDYYDIFYFETRVRDMIEEFMEPFKKVAKTDKETYIQLRYDYDRILERVYELEHYALIQEWKLDPSKLWARVELPTLPAPEQKIQRMQPLRKSLKEIDEIQSPAEAAKKSNLRSSQDKKQGATVTPKNVKILEPDRIADREKGRKDKHKDISMLGKVAEKSNVPRPTALHKNLVKTSIKTSEKEAGQKGSKASSSSSSDNKVDLTSESLSSSNNSASKSETSQTSLEHTDDDFDMGPLTPTKAKKAFRTHFDIINEKIQKLQVKIGESKVNFTNKFEASNAQTEEHKEYIKATDQQRLADMNWVKETHDKYTQIMKDFTDYKTENNRIFRDLSKQYADDILAMKGRLDQFSINAMQLKNKVDLNTSVVKDFEQNRDKLNQSMVDMEKKLIEFETEKMDVSTANKNFIDLKRMIKKRSDFAENVKNDVLTLENYVERYMPLSTLKVIKKLVGPVLEQDKFKKFEKQAKHFTEEMQQQILSDIGTGSIFTQIIQHNEEMSKKLQFKVDLQEALMRKADGEIYAKKDDEPNNEAKRLSKTDIKMIIVKKMEKVRRNLDDKVADIQDEGRELQNCIDANSREMKGQMKSWQKEQEQYQHQLHNELLLLNDTRQNVTRLND